MIGMKGWYTIANGGNKRLNRCVTQTQCLSVLACLPLCVCGINIQAGVSHHTAHQQDNEFVSVH